MTSLNAVIKIKVMDSKQLRAFAKEFRKAVQLLRRWNQITALMEDSSPGVPPGIHERLWASTKKYLENLEKKAS